MLYVTGINTTIVRELAKLVERDPVRLPVDLEDLDEVIRFCRPEVIKKEIMGGSRVVLAHGALTQAKLVDLSAQAIFGSLTSNLLSTVLLCESILEVDEWARICVIGSESGFKGSYDQLYSLSKAALHHYVRTKKLPWGASQQLVCVAPGMIEDSGMTERRHDQDNVRLRRETHPKRRLLTAKEVAAMVKFLLWEDLGYTTNTVIEIFGRG